MSNNPQTWCYVGPDFAIHTEDNVVSECGSSDFSIADGEIERSTIIPTPPPSDVDDSTQGKLRGRRSSQASTETATVFLKPIWLESLCKIVAPMEIVVVTFQSWNDFNRSIVWDN